MLDLFEDAALTSILDDVDEDPDMLGFFNQPVVYDGMLVTRNAAYQLCGEEKLGWARMATINDLPVADHIDDWIMSAAEAYACKMQRSDIVADAYRPSRDF
jgi:hypothetical protein